MTSKLPDYSEPLRNLQVQMKEFVELMEDKNYPAATRLAVSMVELSTCLLSILNQVYLSEHLSNENMRHLPILSSESDDSEGDNLL